MRQPEKAAMSATSRSVDYLVIGGGPAGAMVALRLAAAGRQVMLLEKEPGPHHKVCGEFLSPEAVGYLQQARIAQLQLGAAVIRSLRLSSGCTVFEASLPFQALSVSRRVLDAALLARAEEEGCQILRGVAVASLVYDGSEWIASLRNGETLRARTVFLATGKHDLHGFGRRPAKQSDLIGFKLHWQLPPAQMQALHGYMDLYLFSGGYGGISLIENGIANLCLVVRRSTLRRLGAWPELFGEILRENRCLRRLLTNGRALWPRPLAIAPIPYGYLAAESRGMWRVGDQAGVIPSFTGDGISIALHSAALATQMFLAGNSPTDYQRTLRAQLSRSMALATWLSRLAVTPAGRNSALIALSLFPHAMRWIAAATRIPQSSLLLG
jgi:flavin-dependent dehydrogenase